jgi:hypothetical protein
MNLVDGYRAAILVGAFALGGCGSILNPRPPAEPELTLTEQRERAAQRDGVTADPDPAPLSAFAWSATGPSPSAAPAAGAAPKTAKRR